jgi:hypothetical protein
VIGIKELGVVMTSAAIVAGLLTRYFDWRERLLEQIRGGRGS